MNYNVSCVVSFPLGLLNMMCALSVVAVSHVRVTVKIPGGRAMPFYLGIDPGVRGAFAMLDQESRVLGIWDMPTQRIGKSAGREYNAAAIARLIEEIKSWYFTPLLVGIEQAQMRTSEARQITAKIWYGYGLIAMAMSMLVPHKIYRIRAHEWKNLLDVSTPQGTPRKDAYRTLKSLSLEKAHALWPQAIPHIKRNHNRAEALLIAEYVRRMDALGLRAGVDA